MPSSSRISNYRRGGAGGYSSAHLGRYRVLVVGPIDSVESRTYNPQAADEFLSQGGTQWSGEFPYYGDCYQLTLGSENRGRGASIQLSRHSANVELPDSAFELRGRVYKLIVYNRDSERADQSGGIWIIHPEGRSPTRLSLTWPDGKAMVVEDASFYEGSSGSGRSTRR